MHVALVAFDQPNAVARRLEIRPQHVEYLDSLGDKLLLAGPFLDDRGDSVGSIMVIEAESLEAARAIYARDPYFINGLFDTVTIKPWKRVFGTLK